jgi:hypothetical protein
MPDYAELLQVKLSSNLPKCAQELSFTLIANRTTLISKHKLTVDRLGPNNFIVKLPVTLLNEHCPGWHIYHVQVRKKVEVEGTGIFSILVSTYKGKHQWLHIDSIAAGDESYFCAMPIFNRQSGTHHLKPMARQCYINYLSEMRKGKAAKTK